MGGAYVGLSEFEKAIEAFKKAIEIKPNEDAYHNMGLAYAGLSEFEKAIGAFKKAIEIKPDESKPHIVISLIFIRLNLNGFFTDFNCLFKPA
jgi:tetratricopeptide (TPR) repeat protein